MELFLCPKVSAFLYHHMGHAAIRDSLQKAPEDAVADKDPVNEAHKFLSLLDPFLVHSVAKAASHLCTTRSEPLEDLAKQYGSLIMQQVAPAPPAADVPIAHCP